MHAWFPAATEAHRWRTVPIYAASCLVVAAILYFAVERPFLRLREHRDMHRSEPDIEARVEPSM